MGKIGRQSSDGGTKEESHLDLPPNGILCESLPTILPHIQHMVHWRAGATEHCSD